MLSAPVTQTVNSATSSSQPMPRHRSATTKSRSTKRSSASSSGAGTRALPAAPVRRPAPCGGSGPRARSAACRCARHAREHTRTCAKSYELARHGGHTELTQASAWSPLQALDRRKATDLTRPSDFLSGKRLGTEQVFTQIRHVCKSSLGNLAAHSSPTESGRNAGTHQLGAPELQHALPKAQAALAFPRRLLLCVLSCAQRAHSPQLRLLLPQHRLSRLTLPQRTRVHGARELRRPGAASRWSQLLLQAGLAAASLLRQAILRNPHRATLLRQLFLVRLEQAAV